MQNQIHIFTSNRVELLYEKLKGCLYRKGDFPFMRRQIVVPNASMKAWLMMRFAKDPDCEIAAGIEICYLDQALRRLYQQNQGTERIYFPSEMELAFLIEAQLRRILSRTSEFPDKELEVWRPLVRYLQSNERIITLSTRLAQLFLHYGKYGNRMLEAWNTQEKEHSSWQARLWYELKKQFPSIGFLYQQLPHLLETMKETSQFQLHLFAMSFVPAPVYRFLSKSAHLMPIHYYLLSPCQVFWGDICSDREKIRLQRYWKNKDVSELQQQALDELLRERNCFLANFGVMGRQMAQEIEEAPQFEECYRMSASIQYIPLYADVISPDITFDSEIQPISLLHTLQADMLLLRNPAKQLKFEVPSTDLSIQLHVSYTKFREVENVYNLILHFLTKHASETCPIVPSDVIVMVADLPAYESTIASVFGSEASVLDYQILESKFLEKSSLVQGFLHLIELANSRWEADLFLQLLDYSEFHFKQGFTPSEVQQICAWIELSGTYWGQSSSHREEILRRDHGGNCGQVDSNPSGTWEYTFKRLVMALAIESEGLDERESSLILPIEGVETSHTELLERWLTLMQKLQKDLKPISDDSCMSLVSWSSFFEGIKNDYFYVDRNNQEAVKADKALTGYIQSLSSFLNLKNESFSFSSVFSQLTKAIEGDLSSHREMIFQAVRFCSLSPMRALPAKIVILMGLNEENFPRKETSFSLNELAVHSEADYAPTQSDFDRYLFLEAILSARQYFILSYVGYSFDEQREISPSPFIEELFSYLDESYFIGEHAPSKHCMHRHPFDAFDKSYFSANSPFPSYISEHFKRAQSHYQEIKKPVHQFIKEFSIGKSLPNESGKSTVDFSSYNDEDERIRINELSAFASNPLKVFFNKKLKIFLPRSEEETRSEEPLVLQPLTKYQLRLQGIKSLPETVLNKAERTGLLPRGLFKTFSSEQLTDEIKKMHQNFSVNAVNPHEIASIRFVDYCKGAENDDKGNWILPSLHLQSETGKNIKISGTLKGISAQGLIFHQARDLNSVYKLWPHYLILCRAIEIHQLPILPQLISSKNSKPIQPSLSDVEKQLQKYLTYFFLGQKVPSPLIPEWISDFLNEEPEPINSKVRSHLEDPFSHFYNVYAQWIFRNFNYFQSMEKMHATWRPISVELFSNITLD